MIKGLIKYTDFMLSSIIIVIFLFALGMIFILSALKTAPKKLKGKIIELYISIVDFRESIISTQKDGVLLDGFVNKAFLYHFDFDKVKDESLYIDRDIFLSNVSVHPDNNILTRLGLVKTAACIVETKTFFDMLSKIQKESVCIIRAQDPHLLGFNAYILSRLSKIPFIVQICSNYELKDRQAKRLTFAPFMFQAVEKVFERAIMRSADLVLTDREHYKSFGLIPEDIPPERYANIGFFVNKVHYAPVDSRRNIRGNLGLSAEKKILLYVGRLSKVKYSLDLIKMLKEVINTRDDVVLLIAGDGELKSEMSALAADNGIESNISFLEKISQEVLSDLYYTADVICFTSAGFTMIEAALAERCIVAYDFEWHSEFIGSNERGILVPFGDYHKFAEKVLMALEDHELRANLGKAARTYAFKNYSREYSIMKEVAAYKNVFKRRGYIFDAQTI